MKPPSHILSTALALGLCLGGLSTARAAFTFTLSEVGLDVVINGSGTLNLGNIRPGDADNYSPRIQPSNANLFVGAPATYSEVFNVNLSGPSSFGIGSGLAATSGTGPLLGFQADRGTLIFSGAQSTVGVFSNSATFANQTFATLGFTPGTYVYTFGSGANADSFTITSAAVPEPSTYAMLLGGAGVFALVRFRKTKAATTLQN